MTAPTIVRSHDEVYLHEDRYDKPKEMFKFIVELINKNKRAVPGVICDHGCATGEFPYHLKKMFPNATIEGYDLLPELIERARNRCQGIKFEVGDALDEKTCPQHHADITTSFGLIGLFERFEKFVDNLVYWTKPGGVIYLHGMLNPYPVDVNIKYNHAHDYGNGVLETGWNIFSRKSLSDYLYKKGVKNCVFHDFKINIDIPKHEDDCVRSWTFDDSDGNKIITNGLCLLQPHTILEINL